MKNFTLLTTLALMSVNAMANEINYVVTPSNAEPVEACKLSHFSITFPDVESISIDRDVMSDTNTCFEITYNDSIRIYRSYAKDLDNIWFDKFEVDGNTLNITLSDPLDKCQESGEYHVALRYVTVGDEQIDLDIPYQLTVNRINPDEDYQLSVAKELDENDVLWFSWDTERFGSCGHAYAMTPFYDQNGTAVGFAGNFVDEGEQGRFGLNMYFSTEVSEDEPLTITIDRGLVELADGYGDRVSSMSQEVTFYKRHASDIHVIGEDEGTTVSYDINGFQHPGFKGFGIKNGKKVMMR